MTLTRPLTFSFGSSRTGLTDLRAQPLTLAGVATGPLMSVGFVDLGGGIYQWSGTVPADTTSVKAYSFATPARVATDTLPGPVTLAATQPDYAPAKAADVPTPEENAAAAKLAIEDTSGVLYQVALDAAAAKNAANAIGAGLDSLPEDVAEAVGVQRGPDVTGEQSSVSGT